MYWYEVLETKKKSGLTKITTWHFGKFSEEKCLKFHAEMNVYIKQLWGLGGNLTEADYDRVDVIEKKLAEVSMLYRAMRYADVYEKRYLSFEERFSKELMNKKIKDIGDGINNDIDF